MKPMSWLMIILILVGAAFGAGLLFGFIGTIFNLPANLIRIGIPAVGGALAAFLIVRRNSAIEQPDKS